MYSAAPASLGARRDYADPCYTILYCACASRKSPTVVGAFDDVAAQINAARAGSIFQQWMAVASKPLGHSEGPIPVHSSMVCLSLFLSAPARPRPHCSLEDGLSWKARLIESRARTISVSQGHRKKNLRHMPYNMLSHNYEISSMTYAN